MPYSRSPEGGVLSQNALQVEYQHALQQVSRGSAPRGVCCWGVCSGGDTDTGTETETDTADTRVCSYWNAFLFKPVFDQQF